ncbi:MAG: hypothetical protein HN607_02170, partial [Verrucomicrobia bacterium]|nr:hypothetical protein [Verrucomicrobiota bacterium]
MAKPIAGGLNSALFYGVKLGVQTVAHKFGQMLGLAAALGLATATGLAKPELSGELLYAKYCAKCHGDRVEILPVGEPHQPDSRRLVSQPGIGRVKRIEDVEGHTLGFVPHALFRIVIRHCAGNDAREFFDRPIANERLVVFVSDALASVAVA